MLILSINFQAFVTVLHTVCYEYRLSFSKLLNDRSYTKTFLLIIYKLRYLPVHMLPDTYMTHTMTVFIGFRTEDCSFGQLVAKPVQLFMFCAVYGPSALVLLVCYGYIYLIARGHARAIRYEVRQSTMRRAAVVPHTTPPRYGLALATTAGMFLGLWLPFQVRIVDLLEKSFKNHHHLLSTIIQISNTDTL